MWILSQKPCEKAVCVLYNTCFNDCKTGRTFATNNEIISDTERESSLSISDLCWFLSSQFHYISTLFFTRLSAPLCMCSLGNKKNYPYHQPQIVHCLTFCNIYMGTLYMLRALLNSVIRATFNLKEKYFYFIYLSYRKYSIISTKVALNLQSSLL